MNTINAKGPADHTYMGGFSNQHVEVYARSEGETRQRVVEYFKPKKKDVSLIWVKLSELNKSVTHVEIPGWA